MGIDTHSPPLPLKTTGGGIIVDNNESGVADCGFHGTAKEITARTDLIVKSVNEHPALIAENKALREALEFYANPEIYEPHPHGPAFDRRDLSLKAKSALSLPKGGS